MNASPRGHIFSFNQPLFMPYRQKYITNSFKTLFKPLLSESFAHKSEKSFSTPITYEKPTRKFYQTNGTSSSNFPLPRQHGQMPRVCPWSEKVRIDQRTIYSDSIGSTHSMFLRFKRPVEVCMAVQKLRSIAFFWELLFYFFFMSCYPVIDCLA